MKPASCIKIDHRWPIAAMLVIVLLIATEPTLANKFETISGGFSGTSNFKRSSLTWFLATSGGVSLLLGLLAVVIPHNNAAFLNYRTWKQSAILLFIVGGSLVGASILL